MPKEVFVIEKTNLANNESHLQYFLTNYPSSSWLNDANDKNKKVGKKIIERILLHWDTETGTFGTKDNIFNEDAVRYKTLAGMTAHCSLLNSAINCLWAPKLNSYWKNDPMSVRIQFFKDNPKYNPFLDSG